MASQLTPLHNIVVYVTRETNIARLTPRFRLKVKSNIGKKRFSEPNFLRRNKTLDKTKAVCLLLFIESMRNKRGPSTDNNAYFQDYLHTFQVLQGSQRVPERQAWKLALEYFRQPTLETTGC